MNPCEKREALPYVAEHGRSTAVSAIDVRLIIVRSENLDTAIPHASGVDKDPASVAVRGCLVRRLSIKTLPVDSQAYCPCSPLAVILKPLEGAAPTNAWEEAELTTANDLERLVADLELTPAAAVIRPSTEAKIGATSADVLSDAPVAAAIESPTVAEVGASWKDKNGACW